MTLPAAAQSFWSHWTEGSQYGEPRPPSYHHGQDVPCAGHAPVYALRAGHVAARGYSPVLGYYFVIQVGPNDYDGYCHQIQTPAVGVQVIAGQRVSYAADRGDLHGSDWTGPHLHFTNGPQAQSVLGLSNCRDPRPLIRAALADTAPAGGGTTPIPKSGDFDMRILYNTGDPNDATRRAIIGEFSFQTISAGQSTRERKFWGDPVNVTPGEWADTKHLVALRRAASGMPPQ